jgi:16S rRNA (adenine1518-N6/adenine1519-N6)-dimethyltransferase
MLCECLVLLLKNYKKPPNEERPNFLTLPMLPKKSLGQNFLTSIPARLAIVAAGDLSSNDTVLEIGPGKGFLTKGLLESGAKVVALEKDRELIPILSETFANEVESGHLTLIEGDALEFSPASVFLQPTTNNQQPSSYKLIANIPYYITGAILSRYLSGTHQPSLMVVLVQKEVAVRVCAKDNKESLLSLSVKCYGEPKLVYKVSRGSFFPIPSVDSAVLQIKNISRTNFKNQYHEAIFFKLIHAGFAHKRKFAISNIKQVFSDSDIPKLFKEVGLSEKIRAEDVTLPTWLSLSMKLS